jgi:hypothetical protein
LIVNKLSIIILIFLIITLFNAYVSSTKIYYVSENKAELYSRPGRLLKRVIVVGRFHARE